MRTEPLLDAAEAAASSVQGPFVQQVPPGDESDQLKPAAEDGGDGEQQLCPKPLAKGSLWGTVFNTCSATLGAGTLSLPHAMAGLGIVPGVALLLLTAAATHLSIMLIIAAIQATGSPSFEEMSEAIFGRWVRRVVEAAIIVFCFGCVVAYTLAVGDILEPFLHIGAVREHVPWLSKDLVMTFFWALIMLPLSFVEKMSALQFTSLFGTLSLGYLVLAVAIHFGFDAAADAAATVGEAKLFNPSTSAISASSIVMFAFTCQVNIPTLYDELDVRTPRQMSRVSIRTMALCILYYVVVGFTGYANFPHSTQGNLLSNYCLLHPAASAYVDEPPRVMAPAFFAIAITVVMAYPVNIYPCRYSLDQLLWKTRSASRRVRAMRRIALTAAIATLGLLIALVVPDISDVFQLMGGTASAFVCFIMPAAFAIKLGPAVPTMRTSLGRLAVWSLAVGGVLVGVLSTAVTVGSLFEGAPPKVDPCNHTRAD